MYQFKDIKGLSKQVIQFIGDSSILRDHIKGMINYYHLPLTLNTFELVLEENDSLSVAEKTKFYLQNNDNINDLASFFKSTSIFEDKKPDVK